VSDLRLLRTPEESLSAESRDITSFQFTQEKGKGPPFFVSVHPFFFRFLPLKC
jgi:hypothetical protein